MKLYLSSNKYGDDTKFLEDWISNHDKKILLIFNALENIAQDKIASIIEEDKSLLEQIGYDVKVVDLKDYFDRKEKLKDDFKEYKNFCVIGGNVFILRQAMKYSGFDDFLKEIRDLDDYLYIGYSAGAIVLSKNLDLFKIVDEPINYYSLGDVIYDGINLIDFVFIPHYKSNYHKAYLIDRIVEKCKKNNIKYRALCDGDVIIEEVDLDI